jgi:uncharacterized membrane protein YhaH (DUF805 family)
MNIIDATKVCFSKYAHFRGRARRAEFWWFMLFLMLVGIGIDLIDTMVLGVRWGEYSLGPISAVYSLATFLPAIAVGVRRLHDINRTGWWHLLILLPIVGWVVLIVWWATSGTKGENRYGSDPI